MTRMRMDEDDDRLFEMDSGRELTEEGECEWVVCVVGRKQKREHYHVE